MEALPPAFWTGCAGPLRPPTPCFERPRFLERAPAPLAPPSSNRAQQGCPTRLHPPLRSVAAPRTDEAAHALHRVAVPRTDEVARVGRSDLVGHLQPAVHWHCALQAAHTLLPRSTGGDAAGCPSETRREILPNEPRLLHGGKGSRARPASPDSYTTETIGRLSTQRAPAVDRAGTGSH